MFPSADIASLFLGDDEDEAGPAKMAALANALKGQQQMGMLGLLTGDKVLGGVGKALMGNAGRQEGLVAEYGQRKKAGALQRMLADRAAAATRERDTFGQAGDMEKLKATQGGQMDLARFNSGADTARLRMQLGQKDEHDRATLDAAGKKQARDTSEGLRKEYTGNPVVKQTQEVATAFGKIQKAANTESAAGDMSLVYGFMKILDPGSGVKEGEVGMAEQAQGVPSQILSMYNRAVNGQRLTPEVRADFLARAKDLYAAQQERVAPIRKSYEGLASRYGGDPSEVAIDLGIDPQEQAAGATPSPELTKATQWLQANPGHPKAAQVMAKIRALSGGGQ